jgi:hypothetical protein
MFIIDLLIWGLLYLLSPYKKPVTDDNVTHFIYMDDSGDLKNMWEKEQEESYDGDRSEFDL